MTKVVLTVETDEGAEEVEEVLGAIKPVIRMALNEPAEIHIIIEREEG